MSVTSPGPKSNVSGIAITTLLASAADSSSTATLTWSASRPARRPVHGGHRGDNGTPSTVRLLGHLTATDNAGFSGIGHVHLDHHQPRDR